MDQKFDRLLRRSSSGRLISPASRSAAAESRTWSPNCPPATFRVMGLEGTQAEIAPGLPPVLRGGRAVSSIEATENPRTKPRPAPAPRKEPASLLLTARCAQGSRSFFPMAT